jgi:cytosine/adenosine deaminase-related metal-dependent hydrolase
MFTEMRTAALLQKALHGPEVLSANRVLRMATIDGAKAMGLENEIGSLQVGKRADVIVVKLAEVHATPRQTKPVSTLVYSSQVSDVKTVVLDGNIVMRDRRLLTINELDTLAEANREAQMLMSRAGL